MDNFVTLALLLLRHTKTTSLIASTMLPNFFNIFLTPISLSKPSALKIIDNLTAGPNKIVLGWKSDMERVVSLPTLRLRRTLAAQEAPGFTFGVDNVGWVSNNANNDIDKKKFNFYLFLPRATSLAMWIKRARSLNTKRCASPSL